MCSFADIPVGRLYLSALIALAGLSLSVWSIVYMKRVGKGNPFDAMGHEVAPRIRHLVQAIGKFLLGVILIGLLLFPACLLVSVLARLAAYGHPLCAEVLRENTCLSPWLSRYATQTGAGLPIYTICCSS